MADPIEMTFQAQAITARYADGAARDLGDIPAAVQMLKAMAEARLPVSIEASDGDADLLARRTAELAGMRIEERDGRLYLMRPGLAPAALSRPGQTVAQAPTKQRPGPVMLSLESGLYTDSEAAFRAVLASAGRSCRSGRFHNFGTGTFLRGSTSEGRIQTLFRNLIDYGPDRIGGKLSAWVGFMEQSPDPADRDYLAWSRAGVDPRDEAAVQDRKRVMPYFKAWTLFRVAAGQR